MTNKAVIVAAGLSSRLYPLTLEKPKSLLQLNGESILSRNISLLNKYGIDDITIVVGYRKEMIIEKISNKATFIFNPYYKFCNNMGSLWFAKDYMKNNPFYYLHGDLVYSEALLESFIGQTVESTAIIDLAVDFKETNEEAMKVRTTKSLYLIESNKEIPLHESDGEWIGLAKINDPSTTFKYIELALTEEHYQAYDTYAFTNMANDGHHLQCFRTNEEPWIEVDFLEDYEKAKEIF